MLRHLHISNYALISRLDIDLEDGFSVLTGETGAGKSIILGALGLLCGQRADSKAIQAGARKCCVEGTFDLSGLHLDAFFDEKDIDFDGSECIVRREISDTGKSRAFLNDTPVQLATLKELSGYIIDIHSQHKNLLLGREGFLLDTLDEVARNQGLRDAYAQAYTEWKSAEEALRRLTEQSERDRAETDFMRFQLDQLEAAALQAGEQEELEQESEVLSHAEDIKQALFQTTEMLSGGENSPADQLRLAVQALEAVAEVYPTAGELAERMESTRIELEDIAREAERSAEGIDFDPGRMEYVAERLDTIYSLEKKHNAESIGQLLELQTDLRQRLDQIENIDHLLDESRSCVAACRKTLEAEAARLTASRKSAATSLEKGLCAQLKELGMLHVSLKFDISERPAADRSGFDAACFLFSANKNTPMQDVSQIASGGEIARLMLSLKAQLAQSTHLPTIIFDEIDTGVSGTMAEKMASVMKQMSRSCQVVCITHLPQIAAAGEQHYRVYKKEAAERVESHISRLTTDGRVEEIAQMLSGEKLTEAAINNAKSLLKLN